jgi:hypothetical protein
VFIQNNQCFEEVFADAKRFHIVYLRYPDHKVVDKKSALIAALFKT